MGWEKYVAYTFGVLALLSAMIAYQAKTRAKILKISIITGICWVVYFLFENAIVSAVVCAISTVKLVIFLLSIKHKWADHIGWLVLFVVITLVSGFISYRQFIDVIPIIASVLVSISTYLKKERNIRLLSFIGLAFWVANGIINGLYFALLSDSISLISIIVAFIRLDIKKKVVNKE